MTDKLMNIDELAADFAEFAAAVPAAPAHGDGTPTLADIEALDIEDWPLEVWNDAQERLAALRPDALVMLMHLAPKLSAMMVDGEPFATLPAATRKDLSNVKLGLAVRDGQGATVHRGSQVHALWRQARNAAKRDGAEPPKHPFLPLVRWWRERPTPVLPETRPTALLPETLRGAVFVYANGELPATLSGDVGDIGRTGTLPGIEEARETVPRLPLAEPSTMPERTQGRGAPLARRLWWNAVAAVRTGDRQSDGAVLLQTTLRDLTNWLYPGKRGWRPSESLPALRTALLQLYSMHIEWERRDWVIVGAEALPNADTRLDDPLPFRVKMPPGSERGAMIQMEPWRELGAVSGPAFDAWARLAYIWDKAKLANGGRRIYATRPRVWRDKSGVLLGADGLPATGPDPALPWREQRKTPRGKPQTYWGDSRAVLLDAKGTPQVVMGAGGPIADPNAVPVHERNPAANKVPELDRRDILRLFLGDDLPNDKEAGRKAFNKARAQLLKHFNAHVVIEERTRGGMVEAVRILLRKGE